MSGERPRVDIRKEPEDLLGPWVAEEDVEQSASSSPAGADADIRDPRTHLSFTAHDPRVPVVAEAIGARWAMWLDSDERPAPPVAEGEAEWILDALDAWSRDQLAATGQPTAGFAIVALLAKLSRTQAALAAAVQAFRVPGSRCIADGQSAVLVSSEVAVAVVDRWEQIANGENDRPVSDGLSG